MEGFGKPIKVVERPADADVIVPVDVAHAAKRAATAMVLTTSDGRPSQHVFGIVEILLGFLRNRVDTGSKVCFVFCYEGEGAKAFRREILPEYKTNRKYSSFNPMPDVLMTVARIPGVHLRIPRMEGDDCIAWACQQWPDKQVIVLSGDKDLWPLLTLPNVKIFSPNLNKFIAPEDIEKKFFTKDPAKVRLVKALYGDSTDGIKSIPRLPKKDINPIINRCLKPTVEAFYALIDEGGVSFSEKTKEKLSTGREAAERNYKVILPHIEPDVGSQALYQNASDFVRTCFEAQLMRFECHSLMNSVGYFFGAPFYPNKLGDLS